MAKDNTPTWLLLGIAVGIYGIYSVNKDSEAAVTDARAKLLEDCGELLVDLDPESSGHQQLKSELAGKMDLLLLSPRKWSLSSLVEAAFHEQDSACSFAFYQDTVREVAAEMSDENETTDLLRQLQEQVDFLNLLAANRMFAAGLNE